jgi:hypothetical protein
MKTLGLLILAIVLLGVGFWIGESSAAKRFTRSGGATRHAMCGACSTNAPDDKTCEVTDAVILGEKPDASDHPPIVISAGQTIKLQRSSGNDYDVTIAAYSQPAKCPDDPLPHLKKGTLDAGHKEISDTLAAGLNASGCQYELVLKKHGAPGATGDPHIYINGP